MNITNLKREPQRIETEDYISLGVQAFGKTNLYPQTAKLLTSSSGIASSCIDTYSKFIEGRGFKDVNFYQSIVNSSGLECDELLRLVSKDISDYRGFALHFNYNAMCEISDLNFTPFENCRLGIEDDNGYVSKIGIHPDWAKLKRKTRSKGITLKTIDFVDVYNPKKEVVKAQIEKAGGIDHYKGQVLWFSFDGGFIYPKPKYDSVCTDISTDAGLSNVMYRNVRYNFLTAGMLVRKKTSKSQDADSDVDTEDNFSSNFKKFQGDENACKMIDVEIEFDEEAPQFVPFKTNSYDKEFSATEKSIGERIGRVFQQPPILRSETVPTGFTQDAINDAYNFYNSITEPERRTVERIFKRIFSNYYDKNINPTNDFSIIPLKYLDNATNNIS
ncbi:MAG: hypothetical protein ACOYOV_05125 [Bacteroidales bacterium]